MTGIPKQLQGRNLRAVILEPGDTKKPSEDKWNKDEDSGRALDDPYLLKAVSLKQKVAIRTGLQKLVVVDCDSEELWQIMEEEGLTETFSTQSPSKRSKRAGHLWFKVPDLPNKTKGFKLYNKDKKNFGEFLAYGQLATIPPSPYKDTGERYKIKHDVAISQVSYKDLMSVLQPLKSKKKNDRPYQEQSVKINYNELDEKFQERVKSLAQIMEEGIPPVTWRIKNLVKEGATTFIVAEPGKCKTMIAAQAALAVVSGTKFLNHFETVSGPTMHADEEMGRISIFNRYIAFARGHAITEGLDQLYSISFNNWSLNMPGSFEELKYLIEKYKIELLIIDPFVQVIEGDENKSVDVRAVHKNLKQLPCSKIVLHHMGKNKKGSRGSSDITGGLDVELHIEPIPKSDRDFRMFTFKNNDLAQEDYPDFVFELMYEKDKDGITKWLRLNFKHDYEDSSEVPNQAVKMLVEWFESEGTKRFRAADCKKQLKSMGFSESVWKKARKIMLDDGYIEELKTVGSYAVVDNSPTENQKRL